MKIAVFAPINYSLPPFHYNQPGQAAYNLAEGLKKEGFEVTLFARSDSDSSVTIEPVTGSDRTGDMSLQEVLYISHLMEHAGEYDIIHNMTGCKLAAFSRLISTPMVTTISGRRAHDELTIYRKYNSSNTYVSSAWYDRNHEISYAENIYPSVDESRLRFRDEASDYMLYLGPVEEEAGIFDAVRAALLSGHKLLIAGDRVDTDYLDKKIMPFLDGEFIAFTHYASSEERYRLLADARMLLLPRYRNGYYNMLVLESMYCGTPVIAVNEGAMTELVRHELTGMLVHSVEEAALAAKAMENIQRISCHEWMVNNFSQQEATAAYMKLYQDLLAGKSQPSRSS